MKKGIKKIGNGPESDGLESEALVPKENDEAAAPKVDLQQQKVIVPKSYSLHGLSYALLFQCFNFLCLITLLSCICFNVLLTVFPYSQVPNKRGGVSNRQGGREKF